MSDHRKTASALGVAAVVLALTGCAGAAGSTAESFELHQAPTRPGAGTPAAEMQGERLAEYAEARAAAWLGAADAQGHRLAAYADAVAAASRGAADAQGHRLALYADALASAGDR